MQRKFETSNFILKIAVTGVIIIAAALITGAKTYAEESLTTVLTPSQADCGIRKVQGPSLKDEWVTKNDCTQELLTKDQSFAKIDKDVSGGVVEMYFILPPELDPSRVISAVANVEMFCSSGINIDGQNEIGGWYRLGADLPSSEYKPDGTYGYLSCGTGQQKKSLSLEIPLIEGSDTFAFRLSGGDLSAEALIDHAYVVITSRQADVNVVNNVENWDKTVTSRCTVNGQEVECPDLSTVAWGVGGFLIFLLVSSVVFGLFWLFMFIHAVTKPIQNKILWIVLMLIFPLAAIVYYFIVKRHYNSDQTNQTPNNDTPPSSFTPDSMS